MRVQQAGKPQVKCSGKGGRADAIEAGQSAGRRVAQGAGVPKQELATTNHPVSNPGYRIGRCGRQPTCLKSGCTCLTGNPMRMTSGESSPTRERRGNGGRGCNGGNMVMVGAMGQAEL